jgi:Zn-finger nucleic acid-binding protein
MANMDCPKCNGRLQNTTISVEEMSKRKDLQGADLEYELEVDQCFVCGGVWFDKGELDTYLREGLHAVQSPSLGTEMDQQFNKKKGKCPVCQVEMVQQPYILDRGIQIDLCPKCSGIWLDSTELDRLESEEWKLQPKKSLLSYAIHSIFGSRKADSGSNPNDSADL